MNYFLKVNNEVKYFKTKYQALKALEKVGGEVWTINLELIAKENKDASTF